MDPVRLRNAHVAWMTLITDQQLQWSGTRNCATKQRTERRVEKSRITLSSKESFNNWGGGRGCHRFVPILVGGGTKTAPPRDLFDQSSGEIGSIQGMLADHVGDHVVLSPEGVVLVTSRGRNCRIPAPPNR